MTAPGAAVTVHAEVGDRLQVVNGRARQGLVIGVPHPDGSPPYIVKWLSDGHIAMVFPSQYSRIIPASPEPGAAGAPGIGAAADLRTSARPGRDFRPMCPPP